MLTTRKSINDLYTGRHNFLSRSQTCLIVVANFKSHNIYRSLHAESCVKMDSLIIFVLENKTDNKALGLSLLLETGILRSLRRTFYIPKFTLVKLSTTDHGNHY